MEEIGSMKIGDKVRLLGDVPYAEGRAYYLKGAELTIIEKLVDGSYFAKNRYGRVARIYNRDFELIKEDNMNKIEIELNGERVLLDVDRARELGLIENVKKDLIEKRKRDGYCVADINGIVRRHNHNTSFDDDCYNNGNYFSSEMVAQSHINQLGGLTGRIQAYILEENARTGWVANWDDNKQYKYCIYYKKNNNMYDYSETSIANIIGVIYTSEKIAKNLVNKLNDGWR
jgi:hypothetical protein